VTVVLGTENGDVYIRRTAHDYPIPPLAWQFPEIEIIPIFYISRAGEITELCFKVYFKRLRQVPV
jgi:hypothetical protein